MFLIIKLAITAGAFFVHPVLGIICVLGCVLDMMVATKRIT